MLADYLPDAERREAVALVAWEDSEDSEVSAACSEVAAVGKCPSFRPA